MQTMSEKYATQINEFMDKVKAKNGHESEFLQAVQEVAEAMHIRLPRR